MTYPEFIASLQEPIALEFNSKALQSLWLDGCGDWEGAHEIAQELSGIAGSWIHAYLHRKEGDLWNARYWYDRAGKTYPQYNLTEEYEILVRHFLDAPQGA